MGQLIGRATEAKSGLMLLSESSVLSLFGSAGMEEQMLQPSTLAFESRSCNLVISVGLGPCVVTRPPGPSAAAAGVVVVVVLVFIRIIWYWH